MPQALEQPWLCIFEFHSFDDARAFADLIEESSGEESTIRRKLAYYVQGGFANWRKTKIARETFTGRSFDAQMLAECFANAGYSGKESSARSWLHKALAFAVIKKLELGIYEFLPQPLANASYNPASTSVPCEMLP